MIRKLIKELENELIAIRRSFHKIPELSFQEYKTSNLICSILNKNGLNYERICQTGVVCNIGNINSDDSKTILIRADIDALPIEEKNNKEYCSVNKGIMHACGHDVHITALLGACIILDKLKGTFNGCIKAVFQPGEEDEGGAEPMIKAGVMDNPKVDAAIALHVEPLAKTGILQFRNGSIMASPDDFEITIKGIGGHGACPQDCKNPIYAASELTTKLSSVVDDNFSDVTKCVVSVCTINGGSFNNIIPDTVTITGTARSLDADTRNKIDELIYNYTKTICDKNKCSFSYVFNRRYPPVINVESMNNIVIKASEKLGLFDKIEFLEKSSMTGDDFSYFAQLVPSSYFKLGVGNDDIKSPLHSPDFDIDEKSIALGAAILAQSAIDYLKTDI